MSNEAENGQPSLLFQSLQSRTALLRRDTNTQDTTQCLQRFQMRNAGGRTLHKTTKNSNTCGGPPQNSELGSRSGVQAAAPPGPQRRRLQELQYWSALQRYGEAAFCIGAPTHHGSVLISSTARRRFSRRPHPARRSSPAPPPPAQTSAAGCGACPCPTPPAGSPSARGRRRGNPPSRPSRRRRRSTRRLRCCRRGRWSCARAGRSGRPGRENNE